MSRKKHTDNITGTTRQNILIVLFGAVTLIGAFAITLGAFPSNDATYQRIGLVLGVIGVVGMIWMNYLPSLWSKGIVYLDLIVLFTLITIRAYSYLFPEAGLIWTVIISATVFAAYMIPILSPPLTRFLRTELTAPRTPLMKRVFALTLFVGPACGIIGVFLGRHTAAQGASFLMAALFGTLLWTLAILMPFGSHYPISPFEKSGGQ